MNLSIIPTLNFSVNLLVFRQKIKSKSSAEIVSTPECDLKQSEHNIPVLKSKPRVVPVINLFPQTEHLSVDNS